MTRVCRRSAVLVVLAGLVLSPTFGQNRSAPKTISVLELQGGGEIIGLLGVPLGELVSIKGRIVRSSTKSGGQLVDIVEINGKPVSGMLQLRYSIWEWGNIGHESLPLDQILSLRVYETGGMIGIPLEAMKETTFVQSEGWGFGTSLVLLNRE
jgi:hypothetical protein